MTSIQPGTKSWNSATTFYIARKIEEFGGGSRLRILDMGCGSGVVLKHFLDSGHDLYGYDFPFRQPVLREGFGEFWGADFDTHIRFTTDGRTIPFEADMFDVIYSNQVFEHVKFMDRMFAECARVLRSGGKMIALFPLATYPIEWHLKIPGVHWIPPGRLRKAYLSLFSYLGWRHGVKKLPARENVLEQERFLNENVYYRFMNEVMGLATSHFEDCTIDTGEYIQARIDLFRADNRLRRRMLGRLLGLVNGSIFEFCITNFFNAVFVISSPRQRCEIQ